MDDAHDSGLSESQTRAQTALDDLLQRYAARIMAKRRAGLGDTDELAALVEERQALVADKEGLLEMSDEQLVQVSAVYEARIETWASDAPDPK
ncbi:hypothetical protein ACOKM5_43940 [Streptomyces sp. BH097]|uniref:hypothetical protein n=1 Tax=unclassified Streptomyces TaxID=2593676 RepID=UPI003BB5EBB3